MELSDKLKAIPPRRLQQVVAETEYDRPPYPSFDALCEAVAAGTWATQNHLDKYDIGALVVHHKTLTKIDRPTTAPERPTAPVVASAARAVPASGNVTPKVTVVTAPSPVAAPPVAPKMTVVPAPAPLLGGPKPPKYRPAGSGTPAATPVVAPVEQPVVAPEVAPAATEPPAPVATEPKPDPTPVAAPVAAEPPAEPKVRKNKRPVRTPGSSGKAVQYRISIPAGKCPVELKDTDEDSVRDWAEAVRQKFEDDGRALALTGLIYFARFYTKEPETVIGHLKVIYAHEASGVTATA